MKSIALWSLIVLNVVLGMTLFARFGKENTAVAQAGRPSDYLMIPGQVVGGSNSVIYILDMTNGMLGAMTFDPSRSRFDLMQPIDVNRLFDQSQNPGNIAPNNNNRGR